MDLIKKLKTILKYKSYNSSYGLPFLLKYIWYLSLLDLSLHSTPESPEIVARNNTGRNMPFKRISGVNAQSEFMQCQRAPFPTIRFKTDYFTRRN